MLECTAVYMLECTAVYRTSEYDTLGLGHSCHWL
eukprot:SAG22_NODE_19248_length_276_cov_1.463277_1_plen_33_part_10